MFDILSYKSPGSKSKLLHTEMNHFWFKFNRVIIDSRKYDDKKIIALDSVWHTDTKRKSQKEQKETQVVLEMNIYEKHYNVSLSLLHLQC